MKINPDDPWYPNPYKCNENNGIGCPVCSGVTIRLKLEAMAMQGMLSGVDRNAYKDDDAAAENVRSCASTIADAMIEWANRDEGSDDGE